MSRQLVVDVLGRRDADELWGAGYAPALPVTPQDFSLGAVLPAVLYMMRWGHRRGTGAFQTTYGAGGLPATVRSVADKLATHATVRGFGSEEGRAVLGDMLLAFCLENRRHSADLGEPVQRVYPTHYFSSWVDLPTRVVNLRLVPELLVVLLTRQETGIEVAAGGSGHFRIGPPFEENALLRLLGPGLTVRGGADNVRSDGFDETVPVGLDQLLAIRMAQQLGEAPARARGSEGGGIRNQWPLAGRAAEHLREDLSVFIRAYGEHIPRQPLLQMLEASVSLGLTCVLLSTLRMLMEWGLTGSVPAAADQRPYALFVDCSNGTAPDLRRASEQRMDQALRDLSAFPTHTMCLRVLGQAARRARIGVPGPEPRAGEHISALGALLTQDGREHGRVRDQLDEKCVRLEEALDPHRGRQAAGAVAALDALGDRTRHPAWLMAEALVALMGKGKQADLYRKHLDGCTMADEPNGLVRKRKSSVGGKRRERWSLVLSDAHLDFLVHRHLRGANRGTRPKPLSVGEFIELLRDRYGLHVADAPTGQSLASELLQENRAHLERRLRDLGLFCGVSDAESMKRLRPRYTAEGGGDG